MAKMRCVQVPAPNGPFELVERDISEPRAGAVRIKVQADGGYEEYMIAPAEALALIPDQLSAVESGPLMGAGITTFNALRHSGATAGDVVAVLGIGGLGLLAVHYAAKMGFKTVAIARGKNKEPLARQLGAALYIDSQSQDPAAELTKLGGATVILAKATSSEAMAAVLPGLGIGGKMIILGAAADPLAVSPLLLLGGRSVNEVFPLERAAEAYERKMSGNARFRVVLTTGK